MAVHRQPSRHPFIYGLAERMARLRQAAGDTGGWTLIGSSLGGLLATAFACQQPVIELSSWDIWV